MANTTNYNWETPDDTDLVKDGALAIRTLGSAVDTTVFNNAAAAVAKSTIDAKGDLLVGTADNTVGRLAVGTNGYTLVADSSTATGLAYAAPPAGGGLVLIGTTTFTSSSAVNINDVFSSTYDNYRVVCYVTPTDNGDINFRYRVSGADNTTSNYALQGLDVESTTVTAFQQSSQDKSRLAAAGANIENAFSLDMFAPFASKKKRNNSYSGRASVSSPGFSLFASTFNATTSFTGFSIFNNSGTMTGTISVYGYEK